VLVVRSELKQNLAIENPALEKIKLSFKVHCAWSNALCVYTMSFTPNPGFHTRIPDAGSVAQKNVREPRTLALMSSQILHRTTASQSAPCG